MHKLKRNKWNKVIIKAKYNIIKSIGGYNDNNK